MILIDRNMSAGLNESIRRALTVLVEKETRRTRSREVAVRNVARSIGASGSWVKKFIGCYAEVGEPRISLFCRIRQEYESCVHRVETEHRLEEARIGALREKLHAVDRGFTGLMESASDETDA